MQTFIHPYINTYAYKNKNKTNKKREGVKKKTAECRSTRFQYSGSRGGWLMTSLSIYMVRACLKRGQDALEKWLRSYSTCCSYRAPGFGSQHPDGGSQLSITPDPMFEGSNVLSHLHEQQANARWAYKCAGKTFIQINKNSPPKKKEPVCIGKLGLKN